MSYSSRKRHYNNYSTNPKDYNDYSNHAGYNMNYKNSDSPLKSPSSRSLKSIVVKTESKDSQEFLDGQDKMSSNSPKKCQKLEYFDKWMRVIKDDFGTEQIGNLRFASVRKDDIVLVVPCFLRSDCSCSKYAPNRNLVTVETISGYK